jgi:geranylgeranyl diphosphate synthase type I
METTATSVSPTAGAEHFTERMRRFRERADRELKSFLTAKRRAAEGSLAELTESVEVLIGGGGKRLRPLLVYETHRALNGQAGDAAVLPVALSTEMLHAYLLIHDDIMDHAELRRGQPTSHARFRELHGARGWPGDAQDFGRSVAILVGDLAHCWSVELFQEGRRHAGGGVGAAHRGPDPDLDLAALDRAFCAMCEEVIGGQFLEMRMPFKAHREPPTETELVTALRLKSGRYSVERPVELGAILAGADTDTRTALDRFGQGAGEAFQLQDDILGTFGDEVEVGKSVASDLREGKRTLLVQYALERASETDAAHLRSLLGRADLSAREVEEARRIVRESGGLARVRERIDACLADARHVLDGIGDLTPDGRTFFTGMLDYLRERKT